MNPLFLKSFALLEGLLNAYESEVKDLTYDELNRQPESGGWSIAQVIHHIADVEAGILTYMEKKLQAPFESKKAGIKSAYRSLLLTWGLRSGKKFRAPKILQEPVGPYTAEELFSAWKKTRHNLERTFTTIPDEHLKRMLFNHPIVGKINPRQTLRFHAEHMIRHLNQIRVIKESL